MRDMRKLALLIALGGTALAAPAKWEYATLVSSRNFYEWQYPSGVITEDDLGKLTKKLGCTKPVSQYTAFLNCVGPQGWELVSVIDDGDNDRTYFFKRMK